MAQLHDRLIDTVSTAIEDHTADDGSTWELLACNWNGGTTIDNAQAFNANGLGAAAVNSGNGTAIARNSKVLSGDYDVHVVCSHRAAQGNRRNAFFFCLSPTGSAPDEIEFYRLLSNNTGSGNTLALHKWDGSAMTELDADNTVTVASSALEFKVAVRAGSITVSVWDGTDWAEVLSSNDTSIPRTGCIGTAFTRAGDDSQYFSDIVAVLADGDTIPIDVHDDTYINSSADTTNYITSDLLLVGGTDTGTGAAQRRSLFRAALRRLPPLTVPTKAELVLHRHSTPNIGGGTGVEIFARPCLRDYVADEVTWSQWASGQSWGSTGGAGYGTDRGPGIWGECPVPDDTPGDEYRLDITPMVTDALADGQQAVTGWVSVNSSEGGQAIVLASSRYATVAHRPYVEIEYVSVHDAAAPFVLDATEDTYINSQAATTNYEGAGFVWAAALGGWDSASFTRHALIRFDIDGMAPDPDEVILRVVSNSGQAPTVGGSMQARECLRDFVADEATWNVWATGNSWQISGARGAEDRGADVYVGTSWSWWYPGRAAYIDVTDLVADAIANNQSTLDLIVTYVTSNNGVHLWETEADTLSARPSLVVTPASGGAQEVVVPHLDAAATVYSPSIVAGTATISANHLDAAATVHQPAITAGPVTVELDALNATATVHQPTVTTGKATVTIGHLNAPATVHSPAAAPGTVEIAIPAIDASATVHAPALAHLVAVPHLAATATIHAPTVKTDTLVTLEHLLVAATVHAPTVTGGLDRVVQGDAAAARLLWAAAHARARWSAAPARGTR